MFLKKKRRFTFRFKFFFNSSHKHTDKYTTKVMFKILNESRSDIENCNTTTSPPPRSLALNLSAQSFIHIWSSGSISGSGQSVPARADSWGENSFIFNISVIKKQCVRMAVSFWEEMFVLVSRR